MGVLPIVILLFTEGVNKILNGDPMGATLEPFKVVFPGQWYPMFFGIIAFLFGIVTTISTKSIANGAILGLFIMGSMMNVFTPQWILIGFALIAAAGAVLFVKIAKD